MVRPSVCGMHLMRHLHLKNNIKVYNPELAKHGWQSTHTIEVILEDLPFLVDSIRMALSRLRDFTSFYQPLSGAVLIISLIFLIRARKANQN